MGAVSVEPQPVKKTMRWPVYLHRQRLHAPVQVVAERGAAVAQQLEPREEAARQCRRRAPARWPASRSRPARWRRWWARPRAGCAAWCRTAPGSGRPSSMYSVPPWPSSAWKVALPPMVWFHGSQSRTTGGASPRRGARVCSDIARLAHIMRWVLITALGMPVEPEVNSSLPTLSGVERGQRGVDGRRHRRGRQLGIGAAGQALGRRAARAPASRRAGPARPAPWRRARRPAPSPRRADQVEDVAQLDMVLAQQRIGRRHRRGRRAGLHRGHGHQRMFDRVAAEDGHRLVRPGAQVQQRLRQRIDRAAGPARS